MGLPARQRRILDKIENALRHSDPRLTSLFSLFGRLNRDEEMPRAEQLRARAALLIIGLRNRLTPRRRGPRSRPLARRRAVLFFPLAVLVVASTFIMAAALPSSAPRCSPAAAGIAAAGAAAAGVARQAAKANGKSNAKAKANGKTCPPPVVLFAR